MTNLLATIENNDASVGFRIADPYRAQLARHLEMSYGRPEHNPAVARLQTQANEGKRRFESEEAPPELHDRQDGAPVCTAVGWRCRGCTNTDFSSLENDEDGALSVCPNCGATFEGQVMISLHRQKNCPEQEDKTITADAPSHRYQAARTGEHFESADEARQRRLFDMGGTRCGRASSAHRSSSSLAAAQAVVNNSTLRELRESDPIADAGEKKLRNVGKTMQYAFDRHLSCLDPNVERHIRKTAKVLMHRGVLHAKVCDSKKCQINLLSRPNALIATCTIRACLDRLLSPLETTVADQRLEAIAPECPRQNVAAALERARIIHIEHTGAAQRQQVSATIDMILDWTEDAAGRPCPGSRMPHAPVVPQAPSLPPGTHPPAGLEPLALPPPLRSLDSSSSLCSEDLMHLGLQSPPSPMPGSGTHRAGSSLWALRDAIYASGKILNATPETHSVALGAIQEPAVVQWIATQNPLPFDVLGVAVLRASLQKLKQPDVTQELMQKTCASAQLSTTTGNDAATLLASLMPPELLSSPSDSLF